MNHMKHELEDAFDELGRADHQLVTVLFENTELSNVAIQQLQQRGYPKNDIKTLTRQDLFEKPCMVLGETADSDKVILGKALRGVKIGAITGIVISGILILSMKYTSDPILFELLLVLVGAISGSVMGFLLGPLFPLSQLHYYERNLIDGNVIVQFWINEQKEIRYFKKMRWTICQLGIRSKYIRYY